MYRIRDPALLLAAAAVAAVAAIGVLEAAVWIGRPFPGFLLLGNRVVASAGLSSWPGTHRGDIYQHEVIAVDGTPLADASELRSFVRSLPVGTPVRYRMRAGDHEFERSIATRSFGVGDFLLLFGAYLFCGLGLTGMALALRFLARGERVATGSAICMGIVGMYALTALDLYGPYRLFRLHALLECFLFAGTLHMALVFPHPSAVLARVPRLIPAAYLAAAGLALASQIGLAGASGYVRTHRVAVTAFGLSLVVLIASQIRAFVRPPSFQARQRVKVLMLGAIGALTPPVGLAFAAALTGGRAPENTMGWSAVLFPIAVGYAVLRKDLLAVDSILRRSVNYALLTLAVALVYVAALTGVELVFRGLTPLASGTIGLLFAAVAVNLLLPLRDRLQSVVDRLFFRSVYDFRRLVANTSARLASVSELRVIAAEIEGAVEGAFHPAWLALFVRRRAGQPLQPMLRRGEGAPAQPRAPGESGSDLEAWEDGLCVRFRVEDRVVALLQLGPRLSGRFYGAEDRALLLTLAHQGAVAIEKAQAFEELRALNESLEAKVKVRTAELAGALQELRDTQAQFVHREKMASLGQFVAGIAHEMNNPMNFIQSNIHFLKQNVDVLVSVLSAYEGMVDDPELRARFEAIRRDRDLDVILADFESIFDGCVEGVERTTTLVRELRTFSRLDHPEFSAADLHAAINSTLNLLSGQLGGVRVEKDFGDLPPVECLLGQINQVIMNLLSNALDALDGKGTIAIRTRRLGEDRVMIEVEDDGCGMEAHVLERVFDPFFTTKEVGKGTGLGLAVTYGIVQRHGGVIRARSQPGRGSSFRVELPVRARIEQTPSD